MKAKHSKQRKKWKRNESEAKREAKTYNSSKSLKVSLKWEWGKAKSVTPINLPPHPNCPNLLKRYPLKSDMCSLLPIEQTTHRNQINYQLYWNALILLCIAVDPWHIGTDPDPRIQITDLWIRMLLFSQVADKMPTKNKFFSKVSLIIHQSSKIKSQKEVTK